MIATHVRCWTLWAWRVWERRQGWAIGLSFSLNIDADRWPVNCSWRRRQQKQLLDSSLSQKPCVCLNPLQEIQVGHQKFTGKGSTRRFEAFPDGWAPKRKAWLELSVAFSTSEDGTGGVTLHLDRRTIYINGNNVLIYLNLEQAFLQICVSHPQCLGAIPT